MKMKLLITVSSLSILSILEPQSSQAMEPLDDNTNKTTFSHQKKKDEYDEGRVERLPDLLQNNPDALSELHRSYAIVNNGLNFEDTASERLINLSSSSIVSHDNQAIASPTPEEARIKLASMFSNKEEREIWLNNAKAGDAKAQFTVGCAYGEGCWGNEKNPKEAFRWVKKAVKQGLKEAQILLAAYHIAGIGCNKSIPSALPLLYKIVDQGVPEAVPAAEYVLGAIFHAGDGVQQDYAEAMKWYRKAADHGDANAQFGMGTLYYGGLGVLQDFAKARKYFETAAAQGNNPAKQTLQLMEKFEKWWCTIL